MQLNAELLLAQSAVMKPGVAESISEAGLVDGLRLGADAAPPPSSFSDFHVSDVDPLSPFRGHLLKVKRSSGAVDDGWSLADQARLDSASLVEVVKGDLLRSVPLQELKLLNYDIVRVALRELTPEEILSGLAMGIDVFR